MACRINRENGLQEDSPILSYESVDDCSFDTSSCEVKCTSTGYSPCTRLERVIPTQVTLSNEYTTEMLKANVDSCLEEFEEFGGWGEVGNLGQVGSFVAETKLTSDEYTYSKTVAEVRIKHNPTETGYLKIWLWQRTRTLVDDETWSDPVDSIFDIYEWEDYSIEYDENEEIIKNFDPVIAPDNTQIEILVGKWSVVKGYEPSDPEDQNGELVRPINDCESNGLPCLNKKYL